MSDQNKFWLSIATLFVVLYFGAAWLEAQDKLSKYKLVESGKATYQEVFKPSLSFSWSSKPVTTSDSASVGTK